MTERVPTYREVCDFMDTLAEEPSGDRLTFRSGVAYATMQVKGMDRRTPDREAVTRARLAVSETRRDVHEALAQLPAWEADRVRNLIKLLETALVHYTQVDEDLCG